MKLVQHLPYFPPNHLAEHIQKIATMRTKGLDVVGRSIDEPALPTSLHRVRPVQVDCHGGRSQRSQ